MIENLKDCDAPEHQSSRMNSVFNWQNKPSIFAKDALFVARNQGGAGMPAKEQPLRHRTGSIAGLEPLKQKPGVGTSRTS